MIYLLIPALVVLMGMTLYSLLRGLNAFRQTLDNSDPEAVKALQLKQNQMMWARIKYQGLAIVVVVILLAVSR
ncbi:MAG: HIG1 domain-containing protein [Candidatus Andeanibacterium colombiense]|uniref:HIG1 domain-containing protein n=1 Tax=Candidatus Andeanibacterium colombiense TaxID=3121345 RepID=A0AAJ6BNI6_9SPHN|nr:MAG: HIG1 domain-containing protein [Sphingomonadaceae bacterium]